MVGNQPKSYPRMSASVWWALRDEFKRSMPRAVDVPYLASKLDLGQKSAANLPPNLRALGLIDESGKPTQLANLWRDNEGYKGACEEILEQVFPEALSAFPPPDPDRGQLQRWFATSTGAGDSAAGQMAAFYRLLASADVNMQSSKVEKTEQPIKRARAATNGTRRRISPNGHVANESGNGNSKPDDQAPPTLHIDVQIHLTADAPDSQIESLFRNMAKYIYGKPAVA